MTFTSRTQNPLRSRSSRRRSKAYLEALETRALLSGVVGYTPASYNFDTQTQDAPFNSMTGTYDSSGNLWFANVANASIDRIDRSNGTIAESLDVRNAGVPQTTQVFPDSLVFNSVNGHFYFIDLGYSEPNYNNNGDVGSIVEVDPGNPTALVIHSLPATNTFLETPVQLTVDADDGAIWFACAGGTFFNTTAVAAVGHMDLGGNMTFATFNGMDDSIAQSIAFNPVDHSVWVGLRALNTSDRIGQSHIGEAAWNTTSSQIDIAAVININTSETSAAFGILSSVATDPTDGSVWFTLGDDNGSDYRTPDQVAPDQIVHRLTSGTQQAFVLDAVGTDTGPFAISSLSLDGQGRAWFVEQLGNRVGFLGTSSGFFTRSPLPDGTTGPIAVVPSTTQDEAWLVNSFNTGDSLLQVTIDSTFSGNGYPLNKPEDVSIGPDIVIATFTTAPDNYSATIDWGDNTTSPGTIVDLLNGNYEVHASGKIYNAQGTYNVTVTINTTTNPSVGTIGLTASINDTPLNVATGQNFTFTGRAVHVFAFFTDDIDSIASQFTATINWGDGTTSVGAIVQDPHNPGHYTIRATHIFRVHGLTTISTSVATTELNATITNSIVSTIINV